MTRSIELMTTNEHMPTTKHLVNQTNHRTDPWIGHQSFGWKSTRQIRMLSPFVFMELFNYDSSKKCCANQKMVMITYGIEKGSNKVNEEPVHPQNFPTYS